MLYLLLNRRVTSLNPRLQPDHCSRADKNKIRANAAQRKQYLYGMLSARCPSSSPQKSDDICSLYRAALVQKEDLDLHHFVGIAVFDYCSPYLVVYY